MERLAMSRRALLTAGVAAGAVALPLSGGLRPAMAAAPMLGASRANHYRFVLGKFEITTILDAFRTSTTGPHPTFGNNQDPAAVAAYAQANFLPGDKSANYFTPVIVNTGSQLVVFDSGLGGAAPNGGIFASRMRDIGYDPANVDLVVLTHFHGDHIGGLVSGGNPAFPNARYVAGQVEYDFWTSPNRVGSPQENGHKLSLSNVARFAEKTTFIKDGDTVAPGITAVETFGHSPGHLSYHLESEGRRLLVWGDVCNHYVMSLQQPDWFASFDFDKPMAVISRKKILDMAATDRIASTAYHLPFPAVGFVERAGTSYRWVPASYQFDL